MSISIVLLESKRKHEQGSGNIIYSKIEEISRSNIRNHPIRKRVNKVKNPRFEAKSSSDEEYS